ncbi:Oxysterol-binding protein-related protein 1 [Bienertia sinuspersici]
MDSDRSWMHAQGFSGRQQIAYRNGVKNFLDFAFKDTNPNSGAKLRCPCLRCRNYFNQDRETMRAHLFRVGIDPGYNPWIFHGEGHSLEGTDQEVSEDEGDDFEDEDPLVSDDLASLVHEATNHDDEMDVEMHNFVMGDEEDGEILPRYDVPMEIVSDEDIKTDHNVEEDEELDESEQDEDSPFRGPSRALKYKKLRQVQPGKVSVNIPSSLGAAVGDHALQFIGECSDWVKEICPLNVEKWSDMPEDVLDRLYGRIKAKFALGEGSHIDKALKIQCSSLYRHWRERLKSENFSKCKSLKEAERACPAGVDIGQWKWLVYNYWNSHKMRQRSEKNRANALSKKIQSACGAKSIARILYEMEVEAEASFEADNEGDPEGNASNFTASEQTQADAEPVYVKLWRKTKQHKDGSFDDEGEVKFNELKKMHEKEIQEKGIDSLSIDEAYMKVLGHCSGYARGLGKGHPVVAKDGKKGKAELEAEIEQLRGHNTTMQAKLEFLMAENQRKEKAAREKEEALEKKLELIMNTLGL